MMFFKRKNYEFSTIQRKELFELINELIKDSDIFSKRFSEEITNTNDFSEEEIKKDHKIILKILRLDKALIDIFVQLRKKYHLSKEKNKEKEFEHCIEILKKIKKTYSKNETELEKAFKKQELEKGANFSKTEYSKFKELFKELNYLEKKSIKQLELEEENLKKNTENRIIEQNSLKIEIDDVENAKWFSISYKGYIVAHLTAKINNKIAISEGAFSHIPYNKYVEKAIIILLKSGFIKTWISAKSRTIDGDKLFERLSEHKELKTTFSKDKNKYYVTLN